MPTGEGTTGDLRADNPNGPQGGKDYPAFGGGYRFFPDAVTYAGRNPLTNPQRNIVRVRAVLPNWVPAGVSVYFRSFDVDDPSNDKILDPNDYRDVNTARGNKGGDNRGLFATLRANPHQGEPDRDA
jgi:hypothetical protein